jgi:hypothetical protein
LLNGRPRKTLGLIPTKIAQSKGYAFGKWWIYGFLLFIVAIIQVYVLKLKTTSTTGNEGGNVETSAESTKKCPLRRDDKSLVVILGSFVVLFIGLMI